jgi:hypothetical protein
MARSDVVTRLPLDRYAALMGLSLAHFNHLRDDRRPAAARPYWDQAAHDELARALAQAEGLLRDGSRQKPGLRYDVAPTYRTARLAFSPEISDWTQLELQAPVGYVLALGRPFPDPVGRAVPVTYSGDVATVTLPWPPEGVRPDEVWVCLQTADGARAEGDPGARIRGLDVRLDSSHVTVSGPKALFVRPEVLAADEPGEVDDPACFVAAVDVVHVQTDPDGAVTLVWDAFGRGQGGDPGGELVQSATARLLDPVLGLLQVRPAVYQGGVFRAVPPCLAEPPDAVVLAMRAGYPYQDPAREGMDVGLETAVVRLANTLLPETAHPLNDPAAVKWRDDRALPDEAHPLQPGEEDCPFGLAAGARFAWAVARGRRLREVSF